MSTKKTLNKSHKKSRSSLISNQQFFLLSFLTLIIITTAIYFKSLNNQFTNWDDNLYITENADIKTLHGDSLNYTLKKIASTYVMGNYHPITMLSYCLEYEKFKLNPKPYHVTNLILHLLNTLLVFYFIWLLTKQRWVAFITAILFAAHPMHVESVAWVAERKDVLYSFFYLAALCTYIFYLQKEKKKALFYALTFLFFILAILSKAMAVSLTIALFAIDYFLDRKITLKTILEKIFFILLSIIFGYIAIKAQQSFSAMGDIARYNFFDRILFSSYGLMMYLWKLFVPINLSGFYSYPVKQDGMYPTIFYIAPILMLALTFIILQNRRKRFGKDVLFGLGFFFITIVLVLQILPVGGAIIADRYTYLPYIGLFFIIARWFNNLLENKTEKIQSLKTSSIAAIILFVAICCYQTFQRTKVWRDSITFWTDAIEKYDRAPRSYNYRGTAYYQAKQYNKAITDFSNYIQLKNDNPNVYYNRGLAYFSLNKIPEAIKDYTDAIHYNPKHADAYYGRGIANNNLGKYHEAIKDYTDAIHYNTKYAKAYYNRGNVYFNLGNYDKAMQDYSSAINYNSTFSMAYNNRGNIYLSFKKFDEAIKNYTFAIRYNPVLANAYMNRAKTYAAIQKFQSALEDALKAREMGYNIDPRFIEGLQERIRLTNADK